MAETFTAGYTAALCVEAVRTRLTENSLPLTLLPAAASARRAE
jgi:hypothetical protein